jgi:hypothetical protein
MILKKKNILNSIMFKKLNNKIFLKGTLYLYLKILFNKCHINQYNLFNQVGLVALNILGDSNIHDISPRIG